MKPHPVGDLTQVAATHRSPYGLISSAWRVERAPVAPSSSAGTDRGGSPRRDSPRFTWEVRIPPNTSARLFVPAAAEETVLEGGKPALQAFGLRFLGREGDRAVFEAVSGAYRLEVH
jgi:alpha-L-rhamnosidase